MVQKYITLNAFKEEPTIIHAVQGESDSRTLYIALADSAGNPVDLTGKAVRFYAEKPDKKVVFADCAIEDATTGKVSIALSYQTVAIKGAVNCTIYVNTSEKEALKFTSLKIIVESSSMEIHTESSSEFSALVTALSAVQSFVPNTRKIAGNSLQSDISKTALLSSLSLTQPELIKSLGVSNRNLLHNWDFRNPVNQRGLTSYTNVGYTIDRWTKASASETVTVNNGYISLSNTADSQLDQYLEIPYSLLAGKIMTISLMDTNGLIYQATNIIPVTRPSTWTTLISGNIGSDGKIYLIDTGSNTRFRIYQLAGKTLNLRCVKLELGSVSTLANDLPADYGERLALCQRYQIPIKQNSRYRMTDYNANEIRFMIPLPVTMRIMPAMINSNNFAVRSTDIVGQTGFTFSVAILSSNGVLVVAAKTAHGLTDAVLSAQGGDVIFDANL